jgi:hypothetical protein
MTDTNITVGKIDAAIILPGELINCELYFVSLFDISAYLDVLQLHRSLNTKILNQGFLRIVSSYISKHFSEEINTLLKNILSVVYI